MAVTTAEAPNERALGRAVLRERGQFLALMGPALAAVTVLLLVPVIWLFWKSFFDPAPTLAHYERILDDGAYWQSFYTTFEVSFLVTGIAILLGYPLCYVLAQLPQRAAILGLFLVLIPFWTSLLVRTYAWLVLLQRKGLINEAMIGAGLIDEPLALVHNFTGTVIGMVHIMLPFLVLPLYATMRSIDFNFMKASASLGASPVRAFWTVYFPLSMPGLVAGALLVFVLSLGFYITPELLGGGRVVMVSMLIQRNVELYFEWGAASSVAVVLLAMIAIAFWVLNRFLAVERVFGAR
mgnify:CR=1 FL=1